MKEAITKKLYYKKWSHKVVFKATDKWASLKRIQGKAVVPAILYHVLEEKKFSDFKAVEAYDWSPAHHTLTLFFKDEKILDLVKKKFSKSIDLIEKPRDAAHMSAMETEKCIIREKYFYDLYPYAIRIKPPAKDRYQVFDELTQWSEDYLKTVGRCGPNHYHVNREWNMTIFFADAQDAMMFRLSNPDHVKQVERIKLLSEF